MANRRRKAAAEKLGLKSPARRRGRRQAPDAESPGGRAEETSSLNTPKRSSRSHLPAFSSPANEIDVLQEIFWDPHSPIAHKLGSERRKQTAGQSMVEISDIVNRIAPQEEKPFCYEGSLLGMWIGDDAIPCTPGIANPRSRTKVNNSRGLQLKSKEEELMKLARQFDKNLTEAIQENGVPCSVHLISEVECQGDAQVKNMQQLVGEHPQIDVALPLGAVEATAETTECWEPSSQKSLDLEAEIALNALFDSSTQKCSGALSQGSVGSGFPPSGDALPMEECISKETVGTHGSVATDAQQRHDPVATSICRVPHPSEKPMAMLPQTIRNAVIPDREMAVPTNIVTDDFDLLSDDSFVMQITQNPELIDTPQNALPKTFHESCKTKERTINSDRPNGGPCVFLKSTKIATSCALKKESHALGVAKSVSPGNSFHSKNNATKSSWNKGSGYHPVPMTLENKNVTEGYTQLKSTCIPGKKPTCISVYSNLPEPLIGKSGSPLSSVHSEPSASFVKLKHNVQKDLAGQAGSELLLQGRIPKKCGSLFGDWIEPRVSDEVLDLFCNPDSLSGMDCEDDDLLYRVCDDVERNTQSQDVVKENVRSTLVVASTAKLEPDPGFVIPKEGLANYPQPQKNRASRKTFSLNASVTTAEIPKGNSGDSCIQRTCVQFKNESANSIPREVYQSNLRHDRSLVSGSGLNPISNACLNANNSTQELNVTCNVGNVQSIGSHQASSGKSKYVFRKTSSSQALTLDHNNVTGSTLGGALLALAESKNGPNILFPTDVQMSLKSAFKRSSVHVEAEQKSRKCSQEEIARKKQEALERRKYKMQALF